MTRNDRLENPYQSPRSNSTCVGKLNDTGWLYRKIHLAEPINATIEYNERGIGEAVYVNGNIAVRLLSLLWFVPHFEFTIHLDSGDLAASLDVRVRPWLMLSRFVLTVAGKVVHSED